MAVALDVPVGIHVDAAGERHAPEVIAGQIDQHHVLGIFLGIGAQFGFARQVDRGIVRTRPGAGDRPQLRLALR